MIIYVHHEEKASSNYKKQFTKDKQKNKSYFILFSVLANSPLPKKKSDNKLTSVRYFNPLTKSMKKGNNKIQLTKSCQNVEMEIKEKNQNKSATKINNKRELK